VCLLLLAACDGDTATTRAKMECTAGELQHRTA
jgi:hypothetical protein